MDVIVIVGSLLVVASLGALWWAVTGERERSVDLGDPNSAPVHDGREMLLHTSATKRITKPLVDKLSMQLRRILPSGRVAALGHKIQRAGSPAGWTVNRILAAKALLSLGLGLIFLLKLATKPSVANLLFTVGATAFGYFVPEGLLDAKVNARRTAIRVDVADTIDQIGVMVRAGLGIDAAIARSAKSGTGPLAEEFAHVGRDLRVGISRELALANLAERTDVPELRGFVSALSQAEKLGVPVSQTLQIQSAELRIKRRQLAEEQAMKLPVKILFPMVVFILPVIFIVLLGPAAIRIMEQFSK
jgi:tight adherence protein C